MHFRHLLLASLAAGFVPLPQSAAAGQSISVQTMPGADFSKYQTFSWAEADVPAGANPIIYQQIMADIDAALTQKGYQKVEKGDLSLILTLGAREKTDVQSWGRFGLQTSVYQYTQGQLSLDVFDTKTEQAIWHGQASKTINPDKPNQGAIDKAINKLMAKFPARAASTAPPAN